jgi:hypothetical protein
MMTREELIVQENKKLRRLQLMVDLTIQILYQTEGLTLQQGLDYIHKVRNYALQLFPRKGKTFDLIYRPRLLRVMQERGIIGFTSN